MTWQARATTNGATVGRTFQMPAPGGRFVAAEFGVALSNRQVMVVAAQSLASKVAVPLAIASVAYEVYDAIRARPDLAGGLVRDPGRTPDQTAGSEFQTQQSAVLGSTVWHASRNDACQATLQYAPQGNPVRAVTSTACRVDYLSGGIWYEYYTTSINTRAIVVNTCPAYLDAWRSVQMPSGAPVGFDGKCPSGAYTVPITAQEAADMRAAATQAAALDYEALVREALGQGPLGNQGIGITNDFDQIVSTSSPYLAGPVSSTSNPDGTVTEVATGWNLARDPLRPKEVVFTPTTTTTTRNSQGAVIGSPTTTTGSGAAGDPNKDPCVGDPGRLGCIGLGAPPVVEVPKSTVSVSWAAEAVGLPSGCPQPLALHNGYVLTFQPTCDALAMARPVVVAGAAFTALLMVLAALRVQ